VGEADVGLRSKLCSFFGLDRSTLYKRRVRPVLDADLATRITAVMTEHPHYGHRRIALVLGVGKNQVRRVMRAYSLPSPTRRKRYTKANKGTRPAPPNLLKPADGSEALVATYPGHIWAADFTYLWFDNRFYYLATVIDVCTRQIVGWALGTHHNAQLITDALMDAVSHHNPPSILHNDRGSEYISKHYQTICASLEIAMSASAPGAPWENGFQESFYNNFKWELDADHLNRFDNQGQLLEAIALQLNYYNTRRIHTALRTNPAAYAARFKQQCSTEGRDKVMLVSGT
jgi:transposase InsO family protein